MTFQQIESLTQKYQWLAPILLRTGVAVVFLIFGIDKFFHVNAWLAYIPPWAAQFIPMDLTLFMYIQGIIEVLLGFLLLIGFWSRTVSFICALHLAGIIVAVGYNEISVRDFGLFMATLALSLREQMKWSVDGWMKK
ncbi:MAG: DoxX family membrane protein [Nanoarchaeota archaeon]